MPDTVLTNQNARRRATDNIWLEKDPDIVQMLKEIRATQLDTIATLKAQSRAFLPNEFHEPDYDGHRKDHVKLNKAAELVESYKTDATKQIITLTISFIVGLVAMGFIEYIKKSVGL